MKEETIFMCVSLVDRVCEKTSISKKQYQLVGITCLFIASKYEDIYPPSQYEFTYVCDNAYQQQDVLMMEGMIIGLLDFNLVSNSSLLFQESYADQSKSFFMLKILENLNSKVFNLALYILERSQMHLTLLKHYKSLMAVSAIFLAYKQLNMKNNDYELMASFLVNNSDFNTCVSDIYRCLSNEKKLFKNCNACSRKFSTSKHMQISNVNFCLENRHEEVGFNWLSM